MVFKNAAWVIGTYWAIYLVLLSLVEPWGWFGGNYLLKYGIWGNLLLLTFPVLVLILYFFLVTNRNLKYLGVASFSIGKGRADAFQDIRERAKHNIFIVGIGMSNISNYARQSLAKQALKVPIDILMIDPEILELNPEYAQILEDFFDMKDFTKLARKSFDVLKDFCVDWNSNQYHQNKIRLRVYKALPTASLVIIDTDHDTGEAVIEFFISYSGERRPRFLCKNIRPDEKNMFGVLKDKYYTLWNNSRKIVE
jgi:hypothetical protein